MVAMILLRTLYKDITRYNQIVDSVSEVKIKKKNFFFVDDNFV